jgi:hypothetical protein
MALKEGLKLVRKEAQHAIISGTKPELDKIVTDWLNSGWDIVEGKLTLFDRNNNILEYAYLIVRTPKEE